MVKLTLCVASYTSARLLYHRCCPAAPQTARMVDEIQLPMLLVKYSNTVQPIGSDLGVVCLALLLRLVGVFRGRAL